MPYPFDDRPPQYGSHASRMRSMIGGRAVDIPPVFPNPFADDPDRDPPTGSVWTVAGLLTLAGLAFGAAVLAFRRIEQGRR